MKNKAIINDDKPVLTELAPLLDKLPPIIARKEVHKLLGGIVNSRTIANDDYKSQGPRVRQYVGLKVFYPTEYLLEYLEKKGVRTIHVPQC